MHQEGDRRFPYDKNLGTAKKEEVGEVLCAAGLIERMLVAEAIRAAMAKYRRQADDRANSALWVFETSISPPRGCNESGFGGLAQPLKSFLRRSCGGS